MAATSRDQASLCFQTAKDMIKWQPELFKPFYEALAHAIFIQSLGATIKAISSEASTAEGKGASCVIFDEEHEQKDNQLRDNLRSGMAARRQPLFISISTAGTDKNKPYFQHLKQCKKIVNNLIKNDRHLILIYAAPEETNWENKSTWKIANPNFDVSVKADFFEQQYQDAKNEPHKQPTFITKHLNIWADSAKTWIDAKKWDNLGSEKRIEDYYGKEAYIGLDLGATGDFSAMAIMIPNDDRTKMTLFMKFYIPSDMAEKRTRADQINFMQWAREGWITLTDGDATDYNVIKEDMVKYCSLFQYKPIAYDKALASMFMVQLMNDYQIQVEAYSQSVGSVTGPTKQFYEWIMNGTIQHDNNPVMAWMVSNVEVYQDDANGNYKIHKGKSKNKVDGPCAVVNSIGRMLEEWKDNPNIYNYVF
jgi:phage terminase large subunit-like protein